VGSGSPPAPSPAPTTGLGEQSSGFVPRRRSFTEGVVRPWPRLPRAVGESPSLKGFTNHVDVALGDMV